MFYSNALSVRRILLKIKKEARTMGLLREEMRARAIRRRRGKERVVGGENCAKRRTRLMLREQKKSAQGGGWSPARALC